MALWIPKAQLPVEVREDMIKQLGAVPEPVEVTYSNPKVATSSQEFSAGVATWDAADASLKTSRGHGAADRAAGPRACGGRQPRMRVSRSEQQAVVERSLAALRTGRLQELMEIMAPDVFPIADGGGLAGATLVPVHGAELVARCSRARAGPRSDRRWCG